MKSVNLADAKAHPPELVAPAEAKKDAGITRQPPSMTELRALTDAVGPQTESAGDFTRRLRDESRY